MSDTVDPDTLKSAQVYEIVFGFDQAAPFQSFQSDVGPSHQGFDPKLVQDWADINISGPEFNFVRSIRVFDARFVGQLSSRDDCNRSASVRMGSYGMQGDFRWSDSSVSALPKAHVGTEDYGSNCPKILHRSVFVEWRDFEGNYGFEQVEY
ncbi:MAG: hypothetical protein AAFQ58_12375 [Pseudomonadota bacterium]